MTHEGGLIAKKLNTFVRLSEREQECLAELQSTSVHLPQGKELISQGDRRHDAYILQSGWGCSFKLLSNGGRQIITFAIPGDCIGLRSVLLRTADHSFSALTDAVVSRVAVSQMMSIFAEFPHLGAAILWATSRDEAVVVEHLASLGRRDALERTAHFFLELHDRLRLVGLAKNAEFACPLSQYLLADALGLSAIHINRVLRQLRERELLTFHDHKVVVHDAERLKALAGYEQPEDSPIVDRDLDAHKHQS
jgi:CRP-like cAMP-binding protein